MKSGIKDKLFQKKGASTRFYILLTFLLITITLLTAVSIYCYMINYQPNQKDLLPYYDTSNKLKLININNII